MSTINLDIYLDDINKEYLSKLSFAVLFRCRRLGYRNAADFFAVAYSSYNAAVTPAIVEHMRNVQVCRYIVTKFDIKYRDDLVYLIRHPSLIKEEPEPARKIVRKKVLIFQDLEAPDRAREKRAFDYLNGLLPRMRAAELDKIIDQYMVLTRNEYYINQASLRLITDLVSLAEIDEKGYVNGLASEIIDSIWETGTKGE